MKRFTKLSMMSIALVLTLQVSAQDDGFIYGRMTTIDGDTYEGALRWGKEEVYWTDMFNATKEDNPNIDLLSRDEREYLEDQKRERYSGSSSDSWVRWSSNWNWDDDHLHQFVCQFGEIEKMEINSRDRIDLTMRNGEVFELDGSGTNDVGNDVKIIDSELGEVKLDWGRIETIEFMETPKNLEEKFGEPLYGTVETSIGTFQGFVQWDHDERVSNDKLDGDTYDGDVSVKFGKITSIERSGSSRSIVVLKSGRELELRGSNDVNSENRGIIVTVEGLGRIDVPWREFRKVTFEDAPNSGPSYGSFKKQYELTATVKTSNGDTHKGKIAYDLDESYNFEVLEGNDDDIKFTIPFTNVKRVEPKSYDYARITLKNGKQYTLGESQDVSDRNSGILISTGNDEVYIPWEKIDGIDFD